MFERKVEINQGEWFEGIEAAREYAESAKKSTMKYRTFLEALKSLEIKGRYLDIGAGPGVLTAMIAQEHPEVEITALEVSPNMASLGRDYVKEDGLQDRIKFVVGDVEDESLIKTLGGYDLVYSTYTLHHWDDPKRVIGTLLNALNEGGVLFIHDLRRAWWLYWLPIRSGFLISIKAAYVASEIREMVKAMGIERFEVKNEFPFLLSLLIRK
jgi:2-polyprenyl-3-methyl-5-hydroxy-6-metoxy-1,4-benzoquinol methylase